MNSQISCFLGDVLFVLGAATLVVGPIMLARWLDRRYKIKVKRRD